MQFECRLEWKVDREGERKERDGQGRTVASSLSACCCCCRFVALKHFNYGPQMCATVLLKGVSSSPPAARRTPLVPLAA